MPRHNYILPLFFLLALPAVAQLRINSAAVLPGATLSQFYTFTLVPGAGTGSYTFTPAGGALPNGVTMSSAGVVSGTPTASGSFVFTARVTDSTLATVTKQFTLEVATTPLSITPSISATYPVGNPLLAQWTGSGGTAPYNYSIVSGALPLGLNFESTNCFCRASGRIEGTPLVTGAVSLTVAVTDSRNRVATLPVSFNIVANPLIVPVINIPHAFTGQEFSFQLPATGQSPITFTENSGSGLPPGLTLLASGRLSGTIATTTPGVYSLSVLVTDGSGANAFQFYNLQVDSPPSYQIITSSPLPTLVVGTGFAKRVFATGPTEDFFFWTLSGTPPPGMSIESDSGFLLGTPTTPGDYTFTINATGPATLSKTFTWHVASAPPFFGSSPSVNLFQGQVSRFLSAANFVNGIANSQIEVAGPTLPNGIDKEPGVTSLPQLAGTPRTVAVTSADVVVTAQDGQSFELGLNVNVQAAPALQILTPGPSLPSAIRGVRYFFTDFPSSCSCAANGGTHPYSWSISSGALPAGLTLNPDGVLSGIPTAIGTFNFTVQLSGGSLSTTRSFELVVDDFGGSVTIMTGSPLPSGTLGALYSQTITAVADFSPITFTITAGALPNGLNISSGGVISGTPLQAGTFNFTVSATDSSPESSGGPLTASKAFSLTIISPFLPPQITLLTPNNIASGSAGFTLTVDGTDFLNPATVMWNATPLTTTFVNATRLTALVPAGLVLNPGSAGITVVNTIDGQTSGSRPFTINAPPPQITSLNPTNVPAGSAGFTLTVNGLNFQNPATVIWNAIPLTTSFVNSTQLTALVPTGLLVSPTVAAITVVNTADSQVSGPRNFIVGAPPQLISLSPTSATAGSAGFTLTVSGANFVNPANVMWNSTTLTTSFVNATQLTALVPASLLVNSGTVFINVVNTGDGQISNSLSFPILGAPPQITSLNPAVAAVGSSITVTVNGTGFYVDPYNEGPTEPRVRFAGLGASTTFVSGTQLTAIFNSQNPTPTIMAVDVTNPDGQISNVVPFRTYATPVLTQVSPNSTPATSGDTQITLTGSSFALPSGNFAGSTAQWNGVNLVSVVNSATQITATIPSNLLANPGTANIRVVSPAGLASGTVLFNVTFAPPSVTRVVPSSIQTGAAAFDLRVEGSNFGTDAQIELDGSTIQTYRESSEALFSRIPDRYFNLPGTMIVTVRGRGVRSNEVPLTVLGTGPSITTTDPTSRAAGSGSFLLTVDGTSFRSDSVILFNNQPLTTTFVSTARLTATVPANLILTPGVAPIQIRNGDGLLSAVRNFPITSTAPQITSITPNATQAGSAQRTLVLTGLNFTNGSTVRFNTTDLTATFDSSTQLTVTVPATLFATAGAFSVTVHNPDNQFSNSFTFTVTQGPPPPQVTILQPVSAQAGGPAFTLTVQGANFVNGAVVRWDGQDLPTQFSSTTQLTANVSAALIAQTGTPSVMVRNPDSQLSNALLFTINSAAAPTLTLLNPSTTAAGGPAFTLTASGTGFRTGAVLRWNGQDLTTTFVNSTQVTAQISAALIATAGSAAVTLRNPDGQISGPQTFTITGGGTPTLTQLNPASAFAGSAAITMSATGTGFQSGSTVRWNGVDLTTSFTSSTQLTAQVPASLLLTAGTAAVTVRNPGGATSNSQTFTIVAVTPLTLNSINPPAAFSGSPAVTLSAVGVGFQSGSIVRWNNTDLVTQFTSNTLLTAQVPAALLISAGSAAITVRNPSGQLSNAQSFTITQAPPPSLSFVSPPSTPVSTVSITLLANGANFVPGAVVLWNNAPLSTTFVANTQVSATVPANLVSAIGSAIVQVRNPDNQVSNGISFFVRTPAPQLTIVSPQTIQAGRDEQNLTIAGSNFVSGSTVVWNGTNLPTFFLSSGQLSANVLPPSLMAQPGGVSIAVRNPDGQTSNAVSIQIVAAPPVLTSLNPSPVIAGTPAFQLTARGSGFRSQSQIRWNGQPLVTSFVSAEMLTANVPADLILAESFVFVTVVNTDGQTSNALALQVQAAPAPEITSLSPGSVAVNSPQLSLTVQGRNFLQSTQILWNSSPLVTSFVSATQLSAVVPASFLNALGVASISARNPDGKTSGNATFSIGEALRITSAAQLPAATMNSTYSFQFAATGGSRPYRWRLAATSEPLPQGLALSADGAISGTPRVDGTFPFTVEALDATTGIANLRATLIVENLNLDITSTSPLPPATTGTPYSFQLRANTANATLQWSVVEGALPPGLSLNAQSGLISGIPEDLPDADKSARAASVPVPFSFRIQVAATNREPFRKLFELTVLPATGGFRITTTELPSGTVDRPYRFQIATAGGAQPVRFSGTTSGQLAFSNDGVVSGTPSSTGSITVNVTATDAGGLTASRAFTVTIDASTGPVISSGPLLPITGFNRSIAYTVEAIDGVRPYTWAIISGALPPGVTFDPVNGRVSGTTQTEGLFRFTVRVTDANGRVDIRTLELPVTPSGDPLELVTPSLPTATLGRSYSETLSARGGKEPYTWSVISGGLPIGLSLAAGQIRGTATQANTANLRLQLTDSFGFVVTRDFTLRVDIEPLPSISITNLPDRINPGQQPQLSIESSATYPVDIVGRMDADFVAEPAIAGVDPALQFSTGGRQVDFRIPAGQTRAVFSSSPLALQTGTVAGAVTLRLTLSVASQTVSSANRSDRTVRIVQMAPVISTAALERRTNGFTINLTGFSTTREISEAIVVLTPVSGRDLQATRYTVPLTDVFRTWFASAASLPFGTQFRLSLPFDGDPAAVQSLTIQLRNSEGVSEERRITF